MTKFLVFSIHANKYCKEFNKTKDLELNKKVPKKTRNRKFTFSDFLKMCYRAEL